VIIFALYSVFNQTQRALRATQTQGDVAEKARAIVDIISPELEQAHPTFSALYDTNSPPRTNGIRRVIQEVNMLGGFEHSALIQKSDRTDISPRTNYLQDIFFYTNHTNAWQAIGYRVVNITNGVGVLVRFETNAFGGKPVNNRLSNAFISEPKTNLTYHHVADGVIHLAFIPYDSRGTRLGYDTTNRNARYNIYRADAGGAAITKWSDVAKADFDLANVILTQGEPNARPETIQYASSFAFKSNALPSFIDMEFAILEPETLQQYYQMLQDQNSNATNFLQRQISRVHLFKKRIPIRTAAP
jgi:hypothetical protein